MNKKTMSSTVRTFAKFAAAVPASKLRIFQAVLASLFLSLLATAAYGYATWDEPTDESSAADCPYFINHKDASCLHGWRDNTPPMSTGVAGGSTWGVQSQCPDWGSVYGRVRLNNGWRWGYKLTSSSKKRGYDGLLNVESIRCCPSKGELCHKTQVKKYDGYIKIWNDSSNDYGYVDVSTTEKRQEFCSNGTNRTGVYCKEQS